MPLAEAGFHFSQFPEDQRKGLLAQHGPTIQVVVGHIDAQSATAPAIDSSKATESVAALVDTGAMLSCIDDQLAKNLGLPVIDRQKCAGANGESTHDVYMAFIDIPGIQFAQYGPFMGVHLAAGGQPHAVLLGRNLLSSMVMIYDGDRGSVTLAR